MTSAALPAVGEIETIRPPRQFMSGDEAVAYAALDAGIAYSSSYPGTPVTDIQETLFRISDPGQTKCVWSINEKVAYESALAVGIGGQRAIVIMKQVGLNVASDAFINSCPAGTNGGLVLVVGDDPELHSSSHKQDSRMYRSMADTLLLEPSNSQEAYSMTRWAFELSEQLQLPIMLRLTTRIALGSTIVKRQAPARSKRSFHWPKNPERFFAIPTLSRKLFVRMAALQNELSRIIVNSSFSLHEVSSASFGKRLGILCTGIGFVLGQEVAPPGSGVLKVCGEPFPAEEIRAFLRAHDSVLVLEEGDPILESRALECAPANVRILGRLSGHLKRTGELQLPEIRVAISGAHPPTTMRPPRLNVPPRMPEICKPCGYHKVYSALKELRNLAVPADIGCNTLGGLPPYSVLDGVWAMGSSIGVACGLASMGHPRTLAVIGDSTFFHSGIPPIIEAVHQNYNFTVLILDNGVSAMTGGQDVPHRRAPGSFQQCIDLVKLIESLGVEYCKQFDPHELGKDGIKDLIETTFHQPGIKVLLYRSQCGLFSPGYHTPAEFALPARNHNHEEA